VLKSGRLRHISLLPLTKGLLESCIIFSVTETAAQTDKRNDVVLSVHVLGGEPGIAFVAAVKGRHLLADRVELGALLRLHLGNKLVEVARRILPRHEATRQSGQN
jgi:hypothetical protein